MQKCGKNEKTGARTFDPLPHREIMKRWLGTETKFVF
jgi:hypothetical protein